MQTLQMLANGHPAFGTWDLILFCVSVVTVISLGIWKSNEKSSGDSKESSDEQSASDYFLAGRGLTWWLVGFSLIAANISTEQFVGMSGQAADWLGLAIASYEWMAAITLVIVAFFFLPKLLKGGVYTIPEFLEQRYTPTARSIMAIATLLMLVGVPTAGVIYSGSKVITVFFQGISIFGMDMGNIWVGCAIIALSGAIYVYVGGLKACAWTDLIWGSALIVGGGVITYLAFKYLGAADPQALWDTRVTSSQATVDAIKNAGAWDRFMMLNQGPAMEGANGIGGKLHMVRPMSDSTLPWTALCLGLWIPNMFYWGLNQYIMQRTLASKSLAEGQLGICFAGFLKLIVPFVVVLPGILAYNLFSDDLHASAMRKNSESLAVATSQAAIFPVTDGYVASLPQDAEKIVLQNINLIYAKNQVKLTEQLALAKEEFAKVHADMANTNTNRAERLRLSTAITTINETALKYATENRLGITQGTKLIGYDYDAAFPTLLSKLMKPGITWFVLAAIFGAVVSSLASMLNSASTILTMDIYHKLKPQANAKSLVAFGKLGVLLCVAIAMGVATQLGNPAFGGIFTFIQEFQGFVSPGALCVFLFGFFVHKCPRSYGSIGILLNVVLYGLLYFFAGDQIAFLNRMAICLGVLIVVGVVMTWINIARGAEAIVLPANNKVALDSSPKAKIFGAIVVILTLVLYAIFW